MFKSSPITLENVSQNACTESRRCFVTTVLDALMPMAGNLRDGKTLAAWIQRQYGVPLGVRQCQRVFRQLGFRLRKPRPMVAKSAGEVLCADLPRIMPGIRVLMKRLPRLLTDQTTSVSSQDLPRSIDTMLPILREMK